MADGSALDPFYVVVSGWDSSVPVTIAGTVDLGSVGESVVVPSVPAGEWAGHTQTMDIAILMFLGVLVLLMAARVIQGLRR